MPPIDPPTTAAQRSMPSASASSDLDRDLVADRDRREARAVRAAGRRDRSTTGPVVPWQPPSTLGHTTKNRSVSIGAARARSMRVPPADLAVPGPGRAGGVAVAGERVQHEHRVRRDRRASVPHVSYATVTGPSRPPASSVERPVGEGHELAAPGRDHPAATRPVTGTDRRHRSIAIASMPGAPVRLSHLAARKPASRSARMSSSDSMPTERRTRPGVTPGELLLGDVELAVRGGRRVDREAAHVADVGEVAEQLEAVDEVLAGLEAALDAERDDRALAVAAGTSAPRSCHGLDSRPGYVDPLDLVARLEPLRDRERVLRVALHAQAQRLETLEEQERVERRDRGADVAQVLQARLEDVLRRAAAPRAAARTRGRGSSGRAR